MIICFLAHWSTFTDNPSVPIPTNNQVGWGWHYNHIGHDPTLNTHLTFSWSKRREYLSIWWDLPFVSNHNGQKDWCVEDDIVDWKEELRKQDSIDFTVEVKWPAKLCGKTFYFSFIWFLQRLGQLKLICDPDICQLNCSRQPRKVWADQFANSRSMCDLCD